MATPQDRITELLRVRADPPAFKLRYVLLNPVDVVGRVKLKSFIKAQAGPAPGVSLFSAEAGHYHRLYMGLAYRYAGQRADNIGHTYGQRGIIFGNLKRHGHSIAAVLANSHGQVLAIALNTKAANATFHAEVNLVQAYMDQNLAFRKREEQFVIYTTLKPCKMCAGMIASAFPKAMVIYSQEDTGSHAKDISEPLGRVRQISDVVWNETGEHAKGLFTYDSADLNAEKGPDVSNFLAGMRKEINGRFGKDYSLTVVLDTAEAARRMMEASLTIERKVKVYGAKNIKSPRQIGVDKVLGHIAPLLAGV
jgi:tRNA(Arg) A34 adenosine deaminase TadA